MRRLIGVLLLVVLGACGGSGGGKNEENLGGEEGSGSSGPGLGDSTADPVGVPFTLPEGIELARRIQAATLDCWPDEELNRFEMKGSGLLVNVCLAFRNTTAEPIEITLPPGLIFTSESIETQNGLLVIPVTVEIPGESVWVLPLHTHCTNEGRHAPEDGIDVYRMEVVTDHAGLLGLIDRMEAAGKNTDVWGDWQAQMAIWDVTSGRPTSEETEAWLAGN